MTARWRVTGRPGHPAVLRERPPACVPDPGCPEHGAAIEMIEARLVRVSDGLVLARHTQPAWADWSGWGIPSYDSPEPGTCRTDWRVLPDGEWHLGPL